MKELYVAHEAFLVKKFDGTAYAHDLIGCRLKLDYCISKKVVLLERSEDGDYFYSGTRILAATDVKVDPNDFKSSVDVLSCNDCELASLMVGGNCELSAPTERKLVGVVDIMPLSSFTNVDDDNLSLILIKEYNDSVDDEYVTVNDKTYNKTIRNIDNGISKIKKKQCH